MGQDLQRHEEEERVGVVKDLDGHPAMYRVTWEDTTCAAQWHDLEDLKKFSTDQKWIVHNIGYVVYEDEWCVVLAARIAPLANYYGLLERIPRKAITDIATVDATGRVAYETCSPSERQDFRNDLPNEP